jgi:hypothetical protein
MTAEVGLAAGQAQPASAVLRARRRDHRFFTGMAIALALTAFVGFAPTYYLRGLSDYPPLPPLVHVHGVVLTAWLLLFVAQTSLVAAHRTDLHRRLGVAGAVLAALVLVVGWLTAIEGARRGVTPPGGPPPLAFLSVPLGTIVVFAMLVGTGLALRSQRDVHKRLMLLATIATITPAIARFRYYGFGGPQVAIGGTCTFVLVCMLYDKLSHGRVHPVFLWGGLFAMLTLPMRFAIGGTDLWHSFALWLTR